MSPVLSLRQTDPVTEILQTWHHELTSERLTGLHRLFDAEYLCDFGEWSPEAPYGYSPAELHTIAVTRAGVIVGHVGTQRRVIRAGSQPVTVAGTGGVLVAPAHRGTGLGRRLMAAAQRASRTVAPADYGYLGCREEVVPFYLSCGYTRIHATERHLSRLDQVTVLESAGTPVLVCSGTVQASTWPTGLIDLGGAPW